MRPFADRAIRKVSIAAMCLPLYFCVNTAAVALSEYLGKQQYNSAVVVTHKRDYMILAQSTTGSGLNTAAPTHGFLNLSPTLQPSQPTPGTTVPLGMQNPSILELLNPIEKSTQTGTLSGVPLRPISPFIPHIDDQPDYKAQIGGEILRYSPSCGICYPGGEIDQGPAFSPPHYRRPIDPPANPAALNERTDVNYIIVKNDLDLPISLSSESTIEADFQISAQSEKTVNLKTQETQIDCKYVLSTNPTNVQVIHLVARARNHITLSPDMKHLLSTPSPQ